MYSRHDHIIKKYLINQPEYIIHIYAFFITHIFYNCKYLLLYIPCTYLENMGKDFTGMVVEDNVDSILHMDNHNAQSHSEQQHNIININNKYYINGSNHYNVNLQYNPMIPEARNLTKLIYL
jgi:hypothetical protein